VRSIYTHIRSNVVGYVALFLVLAGGVAYAANKIGAKQIKRDAIRAKHISAGSVGTSELADSALAAAGIFSGSFGVVAGTTAEEFAAPAGISDPVPGSGKAFEWPAGATVIARDLTVNATAFDAFPPGTSMTVSLRVNNSDTPVACTIDSGDADFSCTSGAGTAVLKPGDEYQLKVATVGDTNIADAGFGWRAVAPG
jgi:hypothetical protein